MITLYRVKFKYGTKDMYHENVRTFLFSGRAFDFFESVSRDWFFDVRIEFRDTVIYRRDYDEDNR